MTIRDCYEAVLIELNKVQAPSILLDDFIYLFNKGLQQYINKRYAVFETKQQVTDDLRVLAQTKKIDMIGKAPSKGDVFGTSYDCELPDDYLHILNCICEFAERNPRCPDGVFQVGANKLDTNQWPHVINNYYMRPSVKQPYFYIINVHPDDELEYIENGRKSNQEKKEDVVGSNPHTLTRYGNSVKPIMQIKCGNSSKYQLRAVYIDYLKAPQYHVIDYSFLDEATDNSPVVEFPDYVIYEVINDIVTLIIENQGNPRVQTQPAVSKSIA